MLVYINGKETEITEQMTVAELIAEKKLVPDTVVVEHNMVILPKEEWTKCQLGHGDRVEIISFVGGG